MSPSVLTGRAAIERALTALGERLAHAAAPCSLVVVGGAAINLLGIVDRPTRDVDVLARAGTGAKRIAPPDPLPQALREAIAAVARDFGLASDWLNTAVADQWRSGLPPGLAGRLHWSTYGALTLGLADRQDLVFFKLYAAADQTGPESVHFQDLLALTPTARELERAAAWVKTQDASPDFHAVLATVVDHARRSLR
ncbi:MAG TPA: nucleotidyl transferase AbiEii/AbiGii toxin family protein [Gemmatimonadales bacterium]|nr:nucleotidyl transferase AbiEii/AbiGii toxin family protein [Gemmatimonadales bacterium]